MAEIRPTTGAPANVFERHAKLTITVVVLVLLGVIELASYFVVRLPGFYPEYNRQVSGYTVFQNSPKHRLATQKTAPGSPDVVLDEDGFISAAPLSLAKPPETVRIFLMGGSAAMGADQNRNYRDIHEYPSGIYAFPESIAGQLQAYLEERQPGTRFEVVTAAAFTRAYHQSVLHYLESVSRFSPDWVVSMDGFNDVKHLVSGTPYRDRAAELQYYIDLSHPAGCVRSRLPNTYCLFQGGYARLMIALTKARRRVLPPYAKNFDLDRYTRARYLERRTRFEAGSARFIQTLRHQMGIMRADGVSFLFVLQPMLHRQGSNKALSEREAQFASAVAPPVYSVKTFRETGEPQDFVDATFFDDSMLVLKFFFDDYLSPNLASEVSDAGYHYLDMNQAIEEVPASTEFYTDYCHMTVEGNRLVAEAIGNSILSAPRHAALK